MKKLMMVAIAVSALSACSSPAERMAKCEAQGVSRDTCYLAEQNRTTTMNAVAEKQALENAANAVQHGQSAKVHDPLREASFTANASKPASATAFSPPKSTVSRRR